VEIAVNDAFAPDDGPRSSAMSAVFTSVQPVSRGGLGAAGRGTRSPLLLPVARQRSEAAMILKSPPKARPSPGPGKPQRKSTYAQEGRGLRQGAEPGARSRRKAKPD